MVPEEAFNRLKAELQFYNLTEVAEASGVCSQTLRNWLSTDTKRCPKFPVMSNFIKVCDTIGLKIAITVE